MYQDKDERISKSLEDLKIRIVIYTEKSETNSIVRDNGTETTSTENVLHRDCRYVILSY